MWNIFTCKCIDWAGIDCKPWPLVKKNPAIGIRKRLGSKLELTCKSKCSGGKFRFFHYNHTTEKHDLITESFNHTYIMPLTSFNDGGEYCCTEQCGNKPTEPSTSDCCTRIMSKKLASKNKCIYDTACVYVSFHILQFHQWWNGPYQKLLVFMEPLSKAAALSLLIPGHQLGWSLLMGVKTNKKVFTLEGTLIKWSLPLTMSQKDVKKSIALYHHLVHSIALSYWSLVSIKCSYILHIFNRTLLFLENVSCGNKKRQTRSATSSMLTELKRGDSIITPRRLNINDHDMPQETLIP